jgi:hypothetical protein
MKLILIATIIAGFIVPTAVGEARSPMIREGVKIRVYVPYAERLENEISQRMIVRIENRSEGNLVLMTEKDDSLADLAQFQSQLRSITGDPSPIRTAPWNRVEQASDIVVAPGEAIEMIGGSAMGVSLPPEGESRLVLQVGPNEVAYSNWIELKTIPAQDVSGWPIIATLQLTPGETGLNEFLVGTTPSGRWLFMRPTWNKNILTRVCPIPDGVTPRVVGGGDKWQAAIQFDDKPDATIHFSGALGISRKRPWPDRHRGADFINKPISIDAPSPLEFPKELFADTDSGTFFDEHGEGKGESGKEGARTPLRPYDDKETGASAASWAGYRTIWTWLVGGCFIIGILILVILGNRKRNG